MVSKKINHQWVLRLIKGEELISTITNFCIDNQIKFGTISGIGAVDKAKIGLYDGKKKQYLIKEFFNEDMEITSLNGNVSLKEGNPFLHLHINLATSDFQVFGGHLLEAFISATGEIFLNEIDHAIDRKLDPETNLYLLDL